MIFVDADAFIGISVPTDVHHQRATKLFNNIREAGEELVTSWDAISEAATKLSQFTTKKTARQFLKLLERSAVKVRFVNEPLVSEILKLFKQQTSKRVSLTDCANMVIAKSLGVDTFFSFDRHYLKNGFKLL